MSDTPLRITRTISGVAAPVLPVAYRCEAPGCDGSAPVILDAYKGPPHCIGLVAGAGHAPQYMAPIAVVADAIPRVDPLADIVEATDGDAPRTL